MGGTCLILYLIMSNYELKHFQVLSFTGKEALSMQLREASVKKNPGENDKVIILPPSSLISNGVYTFCGTRTGTRNKWV